MATLIDALDYKPDKFNVLKKEEWRIMSMGHSKRAGVQPRFCAPNCEHYISDKDAKCGRFYECEYFVFDMHKIEKGESLVQVMFATDIDDPETGLAWWVSEKQLVEVMGKKPNGRIDLELGQKIVSAMISDYNSLVSPSEEGIVIK